MRISLRSGEKIYVNGAVFSVDRKVSIELLNDVTFLLESHVMQAKDASTPLRQLYFAVQLIIMDPDCKYSVMQAALRMVDAIEEAAPNALIGPKLLDVRASIENERFFETLKILRALFPLEDAIMVGAIVGQARPAYTGESLCK